MPLQERVLAYLQSIAPHAATNSDIRNSLGVLHHSQIYQETRLLMNKGRIHGRHNRREWEFWVDAGSDAE